MSSGTEALFKLLTELWNTGNFELATQVYSEQVERTDPNIAQPIRGRQQVLNYIAEIRTGFPDFTIEIKRRIIEGDQAASEWTCTGTHKGSFQGIPPTGRRVNISGASLSTIQDGKIAAERAYFNQLSLLQQLGVAPVAGQSEAKSAGH